MATERIPDPFVMALIERQEKLDVSGDEFARLIGVTAAYWSLARRGKRGIGRKLIDGALAAFSDLSYPCAQSLTISNGVAA